LLFCFIWTICWNHVSSQLKKSAAKLQGVPSFSASSSSSSSPKQTLATTPEASSTDARGQSDPLWQTWSTPWSRLAPAEKKGLGDIAGYLT
jgi:hypothetical protein